MNEPKLRFKKDDGSQFPDWEEKKLGDITEKVARKDENSNADVRMISQGNGFILQSDKYSKENAGQSLKKYTLLKRDEFAYNHGASKVKPYGVCYRLCESDEARVPYVYHTFKLIDDDSNFWNYALNTSYMDRQLKKMVSSGARMDGLLNIGYDTYMSINVHAPSLQEQHKIASLFTKLDALIQSAEKELDGYRELKEGMLQKMFPKKGEKVPEIRFPEFTGNWKQCKFGDGMDLLTGFPFESEKFSKNGINLIRGMNVKRGYLDLSDSLCMKWNSSEGLEKYLLENEDILIQMDGALIGKSYAKIRNSQLPALLVQRVTRARAIPGESDSDFMYQSIQRDFLKYIMLNKTDSAVPHLSLNDIREFPIRVPNLEEQERIGTYFRNLDNLITSQQQELDGYKELKKGLLQQMFC